MSDRLRPMLATPGELPVGPRWGYEFGWDGMRALAEIRAAGVRLLGGTERNLLPSFPELDALADLCCGDGLTLDGKIVALDGGVPPSFARLQQRMSVHRPSDGLLRRVPVAFYVSDVLCADGRSTLRLPYRDRRALLEEVEGLGTGQGSVVLAPAFLDVDGQMVLDIAARHGLAGVVAKRTDSLYLPGKRSRQWVQTTLRDSQHVVIGGWLPPADGRPPMIGTVLLGVPTERGLRLVGRVGTGFSSVARRDLFSRLTELAQGASPFVAAPEGRSTRLVHWVRPELVGEVAHRGWTADGRLRHAAWRGLRPAVAASDVRAPTMPQTVAESTAVRAGVGARSSPAELQREVERARAEVRTLRAQISPHFVYNALNTIAAFVRTDPARARELLVEFADYTRYSFRPPEELTTLGDELRNVQRYLALEVARFGDRLKVKTEISPTVGAVPLPFLAVQPLVENAVRHGIEAVPEGGTVLVSAVRDGAECVITVADDGVGMAPPSNGGADEDGFGGVAGRLRTAFGSDFDIAVDTARGVGTTIVIRVPMPD